MGGGGRGGTGPEKSDVKSACLPRGFQSKTLAELEAIFTETAEAQELASGIGDAAEARQWLRTKLQAVGEKAGFPGVLGEALGVGPTPIPVPVLPTPHSSSPGESAWWFCSTQPFRDPSSLAAPCSIVPRGRGSCLQG